MKIFPILLVLFALSVSACNTTKIASVPHTLKSERFGFSLTLPDRWSVTTSEERGSDKVYFRGAMSDRKDEASISVTATRRYAKKFDNVGKWMEGEVIPRSLNSYSEGYGFSTRKESTSTRAIGSGEVVTVRTFSLNINGNDRNVAFVYFQKNTGTWLWMRISNRRLESDLSSTLKMVLQGTQFL